MRMDSQGRAGFQLIELAVVLVIIGIFLSAAIPSFTHGNSWRRLEGAARQMGTRMQAARMQAICRRTPYRMIVDRDAGTYAFERLRDDSTWVSDPEGSFQIEGVAATSIAIGGSDSADEILFETRGTVRAEDSPVLIRFFNAAEDTATLALVRTGRVSIRMARASS
jgi:prepilin-type N-terminal cleavage/methylation domain-containing protein